MGPHPEIFIPEARGRWLMPRLCRSTQRNSGDENEAVKAGKRMGNTTRATVPRFVREKEC
jgi:hypothetical protein